MEQARAICLRLLAGTPRTRKQLADALRKREIPDDAAEEVLSRFEEVGLIDDSAFADAWVESRHHGRGLARRALARELRTKGVDSTLIDAAVSQLDSEQEEATARELVGRKLRSRPGGWTATSGCAGSRGCSPARATPRAWPCGWSGRHWRRRARTRSSWTTSRLTSPRPRRLRPPHAGADCVRRPRHAGAGPDRACRARRARQAATTGSPAARHAWNPPIRSVARRSPRRCRDSAARLEAYPSLQMTTARTSWPVASGTR
ncbi:Regulatory protein RecX [Streptomyces fumanus]